MSNDSDSHINMFHSAGLYIPSRTIYMDSDEDPGVGHRQASLLIKNLHVLEYLSFDPITVMFNSPGGYCTDGMAIYDAIKTCKCRVTGVALGSAQSMGAIILQAFDWRVAGRNTRIMLHDGNSATDGNPRNLERQIEFDRRRRLDDYKLLAEATGQPAKYWSRKLATDLFLTAQEALAEGLIDEIVG